ncbi:MAG: hypothetical protein IBX57_00875 [Gammaproteobacteria bacterium]|nr:hypothetical protein [Gammaproteobacteria bacterium]
MDIVDKRIASLTKLTDHQIDELLKVNESVMSDIDITKIDEHNIPCHYYMTKYLNWPSKERHLLIENLKGNGYEDSISSWMLNLPAEDGFLGVTDIWNENRFRSGIVKSYCLSDECVINIEGAVYKLTKGEGISFSLTMTHSIPKSPNDQKWVCTLHPYEAKYHHMVKM